MYAGFAVQEMLISGVPASITLAQGILESGDGIVSLLKRLRTTLESSVTACGRREILHG